MIVAVTIVFVVIVVVIIKAGVQAVVVVVVVIVIVLLIIVVVVVAVAVVMTRGCLNNEIEKKNKRITRGTTWPIRRGNNTPLLPRSSRSLVAPRSSR